jgi:hypothetical protein
MLPVALNTHVFVRLARSIYICRTRAAAGIGGALALRLWPVFVRLAFACMLWALCARVYLVVRLLQGLQRRPVLLYVVVWCWVCMGTCPVARWTGSVALLGSDPPHPH